jgi:ribosomal protein L12E/L44/L45/RPP1/RPP2
MNFRRSRSGEVISMMRVNRLGVIVALAVSTVVAPAFAANVTVGQFYTELAQAKHLVSADAASAESSLRGAGFNLPKLALGKGLTEGDMTSISSALGVAVTTERPSALISESQLNTFMSSFGGQLGASASAGKIGDPVSVNPFDVNGKKKKKKKHKSPKEPI